MAEAIMRPLSGWKHAKNVYTKNGMLKQQQSVNNTFRNPLAEIYDLYHETLGKTIQYDETDIPHDILLRKELLEDQP